MSKYLPLLLPAFLLFGCKPDINKGYADYADALILRVAKESPCDCIVLQHSVVKTYESEQPTRDIKPLLVRKLQLKNAFELDSLEKLTLLYKPDTAFFKRNGIRILPENRLRLWRNDYDTLDKTCPKGVEVVCKPIFNKTFTKAALKTEIAYGCLSAPLIFADLKNATFSYE